MPAPVAIASRLFAIILLAAICGCGSAGSAAPVTRIIITGSSTIAPLCSELARAFEAKHPNIRVDVQTGGSARGITDVRNSLADIGMVSRALKEGEGDLHGAVIARDGICIVLHNDNPVKELSDRQIADIFRGKLTNWKEAGGCDARITVVSKAEGRSTLEVFCEYYKLSSADINAHSIVGDNEHAIKILAANPHSIGYVSFGSAEISRQNGTPIKLLPSNGVEASTGSLKSGKFPVARALTLVTKPRPSGAVKAFLDFARSEAARPIIREQNFVPVD